MSTLSSKTKTLEIGSSISGKMNSVALNHPEAHQTGYDVSGDAHWAPRSPFFSVVIPVYNRPHYLNSALDSVLKQTFQDFEILVVDDASTDPEIHKLLAALPEQDSRIQVFRMTENSGPAASRNLALKYAIGRFVVFLDSDDIYMPWALKTFHNVIDQTNCSFIACSPIPLDNLSQDTPTHKDSVEALSVHKDYFTYRTTTPLWWFAPSGVAIQTATLMKTGGFWESRDISEDADLWLRLGCNIPFARLQAPHTYAYRLHSNNLHKDLERTLNGIFRLIRNEKANRYPGGAARKRERISIVAAHARHHSRELAHAGCFRAAIRLYAATFLWNLLLLRLPFILALPSVAAYTLVYQTAANQGKMSCL